MYCMCIHIYIYIYIYIYICNVPRNRMFDGSEEKTWAMSGEGLEQWEEMNSRCSLSGSNIVSRSICVSLGSILVK